MSAFEYYYINSIDRISGTPSDFRIKLTNLNNIYGYHIDRVIIPFVFYPIRTGINNQIGINYNNAGLVIISIDEGSININDFITEFKAKLLLINSGFDVVYSARTGKITISNSNNNFVLYMNDNISLSGASMYRELGFTSGIYSGANTYTSDRTINFSGFDYLEVRCNEITEEQNQRIHSTNTRDRDILCKPSLDVPFGSTIYYTVPLNSIQNLNADFQEKEISIRITDQFQRDINLKSDWSMKLKLYKNEDFLNL